MPRNHEASIQMLIQFQRKSEFQWFCYYYYLKIYVYVCVNVYGCVYLNAGTRRGERHQLLWGWGWTLGPLQEKCMPPTAGPSLQPKSFELITFHVNFPIHNTESGMVGHPNSASQLLGRLRWRLFEFRSLRPARINMRRHHHYMWKLPVSPTLQHSRCQPHGTPLQPGNWLIL